MKRIKKPKSGTDDRYNTVSHMIGALISLLLGAYFIVTVSLETSSPLTIVAISIYTATMIIMFSMSAILHFFTYLKRDITLWYKFDQSTIFLFIAGTLTPYCLLFLHPAYGWTFFGVSWFIAALGIAIRWVFKNVQNWILLPLYITLGWIGAVVAYFMYGTVPLWSLVFLALGGVIYTIGSYIFNAEKPNLFPGVFEHHELWHTMVVVACVLQWISLVIAVL